jgi:signal transduction histidine kinase
MKGAHLTDLYAALVQANQAMMRATSEAVLFEDICRICVEFGHFGLAWIAVLKEGRPTTVAASGPMQGYIDGLEVSHDPDHLLGRGPTGRAFRGESVICENWAEDPQVAPWRERAARFGIRSSGSFPIRSQHGVEAVLTLYADCVGLFLPEKIHLLEELTSDIAFALDKFHLERQRLAAEAALREGEKLYQDLVMALPVGIYRLRILPVPATTADDWERVYLATYEIEFVSDRFCEISGLDLEAFKADPALILDRIHPGDRADFSASNAEAITRMIPFWWEGRLVSEGPPSWVRFESMPRLLPDGSSLWTGVLTDISERRLKSDAFQRMHSLLCQAEAIAKVGGWEIDLEAGTLFWSAEVFRIHELDPEAYTPTLESSIQFYAPEWRPVITRAVQQAIETGENFDLDLELITAKGRRLPVHATSEVVLREGHVVKVRGAFRDISESRQAAEALAKNHAVLAGILESAEGPIFSVDRAYCYTSFNRAHAVLMKALYGSGVVLGSSILEHQTVQADRDIARANLDRALAGEAFTEQAMSGEENLTRLYFEVTHTPIYSTTNGEITGVAVFARNITQRHRAENALRRVTDLLSQVGHIAGVGGWEMDLEEQSLYWTEATYAIHDLEPGAYAPKLETAIQFYAPEWRPVITAAVQTAIETGKAFDLELELITARGRRIWVHTNAQVASRDGRAVKVLGAFQDITAQKHAHASLLQSESENQALIRAIPDLIFTNSRNGEYLTVHASDPSQLLQPPEVFLHRSVLEILPEPIGGQFMSAFAEALDTGSVQELLYSLWIGREERSFEARMVRSTSDRIITIVRDITRRKQLETEIRNLNRGLERRVEQRTHQLEVAKDELEAFAYSVSHDLRAPLRAISGFTEALTMDVHSHLSMEGMQHLQRVRDGANRMAHLIEDLLKLSRIGRDDYTTIPLDLAGLAEQVLAGLRSAEPERLVTCRVQHPITLQGDPRLLRILLENLLGNAWKFTAQVPSACIELSASPLGGAMVEISIRDNGAGFPPSQAAKLFTPFHRLHKESDYPGTGIGLAIAKRIVTRHGGFIRAEGEPGLGATFHFSLPTVKEDPS